MAAKKRNPAPKPDKRETVYVVHAHERGEGSRILAAFTTIEAASNFARQQPQTYVDEIDVDETDVVGP